MEHGPITTSSRSSFAAMMLWMLRRVSVMSVSTAVPRIGKKRIRCSGGGSTVMSLMRSSSVSLVLSTGCAYQASLLEVDLAFMGGSSRVQKRFGHKKTAGGPAVLGEFLRAVLGTLSSLDRRGVRKAKSSQRNTSGLL